MTMENRDANGLVFALLFVAITIIIIGVIYLGVTTLNILLTVIGIGALIAWFFAGRFIL